MKDYLLLFALLGGLHCSAIAQSSLEPCREDFADQYHAGVNKRIDDAVIRKSSLQLTTFPSFYAESGLRLIGNEIYFVEFLSSFWGDSLVTDSKGNGRMDFTKPKIITKTRHAPLSAEVARRVERIYSKAITEATHSDWKGLDGESYVFSTSDKACGSAWSPKSGSHNDRLLKLMGRLEKHAAFSSPLDLQRSEKAIVRYITEIERDDSKQTPKQQK